MSDEANVAGDTPTPRQHRVRRRRTGWRNADVMRTAALVIGMYLGVRLIWFAHPLFLTAFLGMLFGLAVASGVDVLSRWRIPRGLSAALIVLAFFGLLFGFGAVMAPTIHEQSIELRRQLPDALDRLDQWVNARRSGVVGMIFSGLTEVSQADSAVSGQKPVAGPPVPQAATAAPPAAPVPTAGTQLQPQSTVVSTLRRRIGGQLGGATRLLFPFLSSTIEIVTGILIIIFLSIYIAVDPGMYRSGIMHLFPHGRRRRTGDVLSAVAAVLRKWLVTQLIAMVVMGIVTTIVLLALHVKAAFALGLLSGLLEFIPTAGALISSAPSILMGFLDSPEKAMWVGVAFVGVHFLEGHLLIPLLMKGGVDLPPALTILSQALMAILFGFLGLMCAVPLLAATMVAVKMLYVEDIVGDPQIGPGENPHKGVE
jgi:predicted PurR-regulated permease PerM